MKTWSTAALRLHQGRQTSRWNHIFIQISALVATQGKEQTSLCRSGQSSSSVSSLSSEASRQRSGGSERWNQILILYSCFLQVEPQRHCAGSRGIFLLVGASMIALTHPLLYFCYVLVVFYELLMEAVCSGEQLLSLKTGQIWRI